MVVKDLIKGLKNDDTLEQLQTRVKSTPSDIEALYAKMLSKIEPCYRENAARIFQMIPEYLTHSLLDIALALNNKFDQVSEIFIQDALSLSARTERRIPTISAGLLEVVHLKENSVERGREKFSFLEGFSSLPFSPSETAQLSTVERHRYVDFIHRTARDFLRESEQGQRFLEANSRSCPTTLSTYVRAVLSKVTLLGLPEKPADMEAPSNTETRSITFRYGTTGGIPSEDFKDTAACVSVNELMHRLLLEECYTRAANLSLCDDVDRTLATVYQRCQTASPISHWPTQWGLQPWRMYKCGERVSWCERSSRSSSLDSFHSARSETRLFSYRPVDFLGLAASYGLCCYVLKVLDLQQEHLQKDCIDYLLCCSMPALRDHAIHSVGRYRLPNSINLVVQLLNRGGNPNVYVEDNSNTVWGYFLQQISCTRDFARTPFAMAARTFLENGADVHMKVKNELSIEKSPQEYPESSKVYFLHVKSVLYVIRGWLEHTPELTALEEIILAKGGYDCHRFVQVAFEKDGYRPYNISERQHDKLIASLSAAHHGYEKDPEAPEYSLWAHQLAKSYMQISEEDGGSDSRTSSDEDVTSDTDAEEEFHDSVDSPIMTDVQDCQSIDE